jgi:hypothetical protein
VSSEIQDDKFLFTVSDDRERLSRVMKKGRITGLSPLGREKPRHGGLDEKIVIANKFVPTKAETRLNSLSSLDHQQ